MHFVYNHVFDFADEIRMDPVMGMPRDFLHWIILSLFGYHIVKAIDFQNYTCRCVFNRAWKPKSTSESANHASRVPAIGAALGKH